MTFAIRVIRKGRWNFDGRISAIPDYPADPLADLETSGNALSIYCVSTEVEIERLAAGIAATRDNIDNVDYAAVDLSALNLVGLRTEQVAGKTPDEIVNSWHQDIVGLTIGSILDLAGIIYRVEKKRINEKRIGQLLIGSAANGHIKKLSVPKPKMQIAIEELLTKAGRSWAN